jgi:hypothetical protein
MTPEKTRRTLTAIGFLSGVLASLNALRDARSLWPPDALWAALQSPQRFELTAGLALIVVALLASILLKRD